MLPNEGTKKLVSFLPLLPTSSEVFVDCVDSEFLAVMMVPLFFQQKSVDPIPVKHPIPQDAIRNRSKAAVERRRADHKAKHKKEEIAKRERNDQCAKSRRLKDTAVSSDEDPSPPPP
jgi:hypothetical protein